MIPVIHILNRDISTYALLAGVGAIIAVFVIPALGRKRGANYVRTQMMLLFAGLGALIGGHILYGITNMKELIRFIKELGSIGSFREFYTRLSLIFGGAVFYGGLILAIAVGAIYLAITEKKKDKGVYYDLGAMAIPLFHGFGRIGCFLAGCCYGVESKIGFVYHHSLAEGANGVCRFPVQLVEAGLNFALFFVLLSLFRRKKLEGKLMGLYFVTYPVYRFVLEFFRGDVYRGFVGPFSTSQIISIALFIVGIVLLARKRKPKTEEE